MIWYVHGANSSPASFAFIKHMLPPHAFYYFTYSCETPLAETVDRFVAEVSDAKKRGETVEIVAHSLGGVIAMAAAARLEKSAIDKIITMSSPFGGSKAASIARWIAPSQLMDDIHVSSPVIRALRNASDAGEIPRVTSIVTTEGGIDTMFEPNDGVVTVASQTALKGPSYLHVPRNHFEVLLCYNVVGDIARRMFIAAAA